MEKVRYPYKWHLQIGLSIGMAVICVFAFISNPTHPQILEVSFFVTLMISGIIANAMFGIYGSLDKSARTISRTDYFFITKSLDIKNITEVKFIPTWQFANEPKTLHIIAEEHGVLTYISFPQSGWRDKHLASMATELKKLNPKIQCNEEAFELMRKYEHV